MTMDTNVKKERGRTDNRKSLLGKGDVDRNIALAAWVDAVRNACTFQDAVNVVSDIYMSGWDDCNEMTKDGRGWDK